MFGYSLAINADASTLAVGAPSELPNAVYLYTAVAGSGLWNLQRKLSTTDSDMRVVLGALSFGFSVALSAAGDTLAVGAPGAGAGQGVVVFGRDANGGWTNQTGLLQTNSSDSYFGWSLSMNGAGDALAIGVPYGSIQAFAGAVFTLTRTAGGAWNPFPSLVSPPSDSDDAADRLFGHTVSMAAQGSLVVSAVGEAPAGAWWSVGKHNTGMMWGANMGGGFESWTMADACATLCATVTVSGILNRMARIGIKWVPNTL
jgi:hypothetical protein